LPCYRGARSESACHSFIHSFIRLVLKMAVSNALSTLIPSRKKSEVWKHFRFCKQDDEDSVVDKNKAICLMCNAEVKCCSNTANLRNHLMRHAGCNTHTPTAEHTTEDFKCIHKQNSSQFSSCTEDHWINCKDIRPYSVVENYGFHYMLNVLEPRYSIPSRKRMSEEIIPKLYIEVKQKITRSLKTADRVALTCDGWTSRHQDTRHNYLPLFRWLGSHFKRVSDQSYAR